MRLNQGRGLAIVLAFFRVRRTIRSDDADLLRN